MTIEDLSARLERVERANRRMKAVAAGLTVLTLSIVALGQAASPPKVIQAGRFEVVDDKGTSWGAFRVATKGNGAVFEAFHDGGLTGASLSTQADGGSFLNLWDRKHDAMANLAANEKTTGLVLGRNGPREFARLSMMEDGKPMLRLRDQENWTSGEQGRNDRFVLTLARDGSPTLRIQRPFGQDIQPSPMLELVDKDAKVIFQAPGK